MGRYVERAENLARMLAVAESFSAGNDDHAWVSLLETFTDEDAFAETGRQINGLNLSRWYLTDRDHPNTVVSALTAARENARALRHVVSTELWRQINMLHGRFAALTPRQVTLSKVHALCEQARLGCQAHFGIADTTWYRDEAWLFHKLGCELERADQTTRLIDIKYFQIKAADESSVVPPDAVWWNTLLRSASGYHAFRRKQPLDAGPSDAAAFLLFDSDFPRSVRLSALSAFDRLRELEQDYGAGPDQALAVARSNFSRVLQDRPEKLAGRPLHAYLDQVQRAVSGFSEALAARYFDGD